MGVALSGLSALSVNRQLRDDLDESPYCLIRECSRALSRLPHVNVPQQDTRELRIACLSQGPARVWRRQAGYPQRRPRRVAASWFRDRTGRTPGREPIPHSPECSTPLA